MASFIHKPEWKLQRPATVTLEEVAYELQISVRTARRRVQDKTIPAVKVGLFWRVPASYIEDLRNGSSPNTLRGMHDPQEALPAGHTYKN
jgi:excisionase family DNA binding protein